VVDGAHVDMVTAGAVLINGASCGDARQDADADPAVVTIAATDADLSRRLREGSRVRAT
jgi:hypothetical protein